MLSHEFSCDVCRKKKEAEYNGAHYLPPIGWFQLHDIHLSEKLNLHICGDCWKLRRVRMAQPKKRAKR